MFLLSDIITYVRRIIKSPSDAVISDQLIIDYINRFWVTDVDARMQLFDLKTKYQFVTSPGVDRYNMPMYSVQVEPTGPGSQTVGMYPVYQGFLDTAYVEGIQVPIQSQKAPFFNIWPNVVQSLPVVLVGDGTAGPYTINFPIVSNQTPSNPPVNGILRGHVDIAGVVATGINQDPPFGTTLNDNIQTQNIDAAVFITSIDSSGNNVVVSDSGQFFFDGVTNWANYGLLMTPGPAPFGYSALPGGYSLTSNTVNYITGVANVTFPVNIPAGNDINVQCFFFQTGLPRSILFYNNTLTLRSPPDQQYLVEIDAYLSPSCFLNTSQGIPFGYMCEYLARGAARKILSDTGDVEQFTFYEPLFREQEMLVWKRSQRQFTSSRTQTIYSQGLNQGQSGFSNIGGSSL